MRHKGELSSSAVDRGWPHQVALPQSQTMGANYGTIHAFCLELSLCRRGHSVIGPDDDWWCVFCFAEREHAEKFRFRFGGEWFDPAKRGKGKAWSVWGK